MNTNGAFSGALLVIALLAAGCARMTPATTAVRQDDGTYKVTRGFVVMPSLDDALAFTCKGDYDVATMMHGVKYEWPKGRGSLMDRERLTFEGKGLRCEVIKRTLTVNGQYFGELRVGDCVRIAPDGRVFVDDDERPPLAE